MLIMLINDTHEKITCFWLAESSAVQVINTSAKSVTTVQINLAERQWEIFEADDVM